MTDSGSQSNRNEKKKGLKEDEMCVRAYCAHLLRNDVENIEFALTPS